MPRRPRRPRLRNVASPARARSSGRARIAEAPLEYRDDRRPGSLGPQNARADPDDREPARLRALDLVTAESALGPDEEPDACARRQAGWQARRQRLSRRPLGARARRHGCRRAFPEAELELGGLVERQQVGERAGRAHGRNDGAAALLGGLRRDALPATGAVAPAAGLERDDGPRGQHRDDVRDPELGGRPHDRLHLVALGHGLHETDLQGRLARAGGHPEYGPGRLLADRLEAHGVFAAGAVGGQHGVTRAEPQHTREVTGLAAVERDVAAGDALRRDREAAHGAPAWSIPRPTGIRGARTRGRRAWRRGWGPRRRECRRAAAFRPAGAHGRTGPRG